MNRPLIIAISLFFALMIGIILVWPKYQELKLKKEEVLQKEKRLENLKQYFKDLKKISQKLEEYQDQLLKVEMALPPTFFLPPLYAFFQKTISDNGLILKEINLAGSQSLPERGELKEHSIKISFSGSYPSFKNFLSDLEKSARFIQIDSIEIFPPKEKKEDFGFELTVKVYSY
jgi:Tfp pilus assembly protein PilO